MWHSRGQEPCAPYPAEPEAFSLALRPDRLRLPLLVAYAYPVQASLNLRTSMGWSSMVHLSLRHVIICLTCNSHWIVWRTSSTFFLIAQRTATSGHSIWTSCSTVVLLQTL